jgi:hypothetical protein
MVEVTARRPRPTHEGSGFTMTIASEIIGANALGEHPGRWVLARDANLGDRVPPSRVTGRAEPASPVVVHPCDAALPRSRSRPRRSSTMPDTADACVSDAGGAHGRTSVVHQLLGPACARWDRPFRRSTGPAATSPSGAARLGPRAHLSRTVMTASICRSSLIGRAEARLRRPLVRRPATARSSNATLDPCPMPG